MEIGDKVFVAILVTGGETRPIIHTDVFATQEEAIKHVEIWAEQEGMTLLRHWEWQILANSWQCTVGYKSYATIQRRPIERWA